MGGEDKMLRKFGFKKGEARESEARIKLQKELFSYSLCAEHGFPHKPSAIAYDPLLKLLAIGTKHGLIRIVGAPGVEFSGQHKGDVSVTRLLFLPDQGRLVSLCSDNSLHLWEINFRDKNSVLEEVKSFTMEANNKLMAISAWCLTKDSTQLLLGTEGGNIYILEMPSFSQSEQIIYQDVVMQNVPDDFKVNPGAVEAISQQPTNPDKFLIGYNRGLVVFWDNKESNADQTYNATQQLESVCWHRDGTQFMTAHADGSYIIWSSTDSTKPKEQANTPYGPFPCKAINKISWKTAKADPLIVFSGGMPRASYGDRNTVSVTQGVKQVVYDFTSKIIDFIPLCTAAEIADSDKLEYDDPHSLVVLAEEELVAIDLQSENWPCYKLPYLASLHSSAITCAQHVTNVPPQLWTKITDAGEAQANGYSPRDWPIWGGKNLKQEVAGHDLFLTGHEDGSVRFWDASTICFKLLYKLDTASLFGEGHHGDHANQDGDEEWPPFRKVGTFDPYSDDPRLGVQKIVLCPNSETLVVGGTAGQVVVLQFEREVREHEVKVVTVNIVSDRDNFVWKAHDPLTVRGGDLKFPVGFQPSCVMQLHPPATCTALALHSEWQLVAAGTGHGFGVFDYVQKKEVASKCTLNPNDLTGTGESAMSRRKSFKKSLRESFRRLRKRRSERQKRAAAAAKAEEKPAEQKPDQPSTEKKTEEQGGTEAGTASPAESEGAAGGPAATESTPTQASEPQPATTPSQEVRTIERSIEARSPDDGMVSMVRALYFADTFLLNAQNHGPTLWAGTNAGTVYVYQVVVPPNDKRDSEAVTCQLGKEIHLKHRAPVYAINIIDRLATPLPGPLDVQNERARAPDMTGHHQVLICSEEQFKIFSLPYLKPQNKFKLTAHEGSKVRKVGFVNFRSRSDENYSENDLAVLTNTGDVNVFTVPQLRRQLRQPEVVSRENVNGIASCVFTSYGLGFFQPSPSEYMSFSLSARTTTRPECQVELKEGMRPVPTEESPADDTPTVEQTVVPTETQATPEKAEDGAAEGDKAEEQASAEGANDSVAAGDMTIDSVKVHLSEDPNQSTHIISQSRVTKMVVKRTVISEQSTDGSTVSSQQTTTVREMTSTDDGTGASSSVVTTTTTSSSGPDGEETRVETITE